MKRSIDEAGFDLSSITYVNAHATSTPVGDSAEARAIASLFPGVAVSSIKGNFELPYKFAKRIWFAVLTTF